MTVSQVKRYSPESNIVHAIEQVDEAVSFAQGPDAQRWWRWRTGLFFTDLTLCLCMIVLTVCILSQRSAPDLCLGLGIVSTFGIIALSVRKTREENFAKSISRQAVEYGLWLDDNDAEAPQAHYLSLYPMAHRLKVLENLSGFPSSEAYETLKKIAERNDIPHAWWAYVAVYSKVYHKEKKDRLLLEKIKQLP